VLEEGARERMVGRHEGDHSAVEVHEDEKKGGCEGRGSQQPANQREEGCKKVEGDLEMERRFPIFGDKGVDPAGANPCHKGAEKISHDWQNASEKCHTVAERRVAAGSGVGFEEDGAHAQRQCGSVLGNPFGGKAPPE
jgi:hypothetical protein